MTELKGITCKKEEKYCLFCINDFSDEIRNAMCTQLASICHGTEKADSGSRLYSYKNTLKEFIKRYEEKKVETKKGMIGEVLIHLMLEYYFDEYKVVSPFFNMEERSIKKGYDVVLTERDKANIWLIEVKSGEMHANKNSNQTMNELLNTAKSDLNKRLNEENVSLWLEAINGAMVSYNSKNNMKDAVIDVLTNFGEEAAEGNNTSKDKNVFLTGVLFSDLNDRVEQDNIINKQKRVEKANIFKYCYILALQKETYDKIYQFMKDEIENEEK